jgi:Peroxiredoxin
MDLDFKGKAVSTIGNPPKVGDKFPDFKVLDKAGKEVNLDDLLDKPLLISVVPDIDTRVCSIQTKRFNEDVDSHSEVNFVTISTNTIAQQSDWCAAENVQNMKMLSDADKNFGDATKLLIESLGILARSVWIVDTNKQITYSEILKEISTEPNYDKALEQLNN